MNKETILVIDDEDQLRQLLSRIIRLEGFTVLEVPTLKQAWSIIEKSEPDIILCDVKLPDGNGVDFVPELKKKYQLSKSYCLQHMYSRWYSSHEKRSDGLYRERKR